MAHDRPSARPLSPHLTIWRWRANMAVSIMHRVTGSGLATAGIVLMLWGLVALASGPDSYATFLQYATGPLGLVVAVGLTWFVFQHMASGVRHLVMDTGAGYSLFAAINSARATFVVSTILTALLWALILV